eukprot:9355-Heterococcus_DN1.PRE.1
MCLRCIAAPCSSHQQQLYSVLAFVLALMCCVQAAQAQDSSNTNSVSRDFAEARAFLHGKSWVWCDDNFINANRIAQTCPADARPFLYQVPSDLSPFRELLEAFEVRPQFSTKDYVGVLQTLHTEQQQQQQQRLSQSS